MLCLLGLKKPHHGTYHPVILHPVRIPEMHVVSSTNNGKSPSYLYWWYKQWWLNLGFVFWHQKQLEQLTFIHVECFDFFFTKPFNQHVSLPVIWTWWMVINNLWNCSARMCSFKSQISVDSKHRGRPWVSLLWFIFSPVNFLSQPLISQSP